MSDEGETPSAPPRASRFREHTNTSNSIRPPPDELWKDIGIENLIEKFNEENDAPPTTSRKSSRNAAPALRRMTSDKSAKATPGMSASAPLGVTTSNSSASHEGTFGRLQRAWNSVFSGVLGKRKAGKEDAERDKDREVLDERKKAAEAAYHEAKALGLLPTPKVFVRPSVAARIHGNGTSTQLSSTARRLTPAVPNAATTTPVRSPRTPTLYHTPSKRDLQKQRKLSKRVSNLESKLASARKELHAVLHGDLPSVPYMPAILPPTPTTSHSDNETETPPEDRTTPELQPEPRSIGKIIKKRKATTADHDSDYVPLPTDSEGDIDMHASASEHEHEPEPEPERNIKRVKSSASKRNIKRASSRLPKRSPRSSPRDKPVTVVPDGVRVPPIPAIPLGVEGKKVRIGEGEDGYGGLEHEMF